MKEILKGLEAKDQDVQKGGTKVEQGKLPCMEKFDEVTHSWN